MTVLTLWPKSDIDSDTFRAVRENIRAGPEMRPAFFMGKAMNSEELTLELIASLYREATKISLIISDLRMDSSLNKSELCHELELSDFRLAELDVTARHIEKSGVAR